LSTKKKKECPLNFINGYSLGFILEIKGVSEHWVRRLGVFACQPAQEDKGLSGRGLLTERPQRINSLLCGRRYGVFDSFVSDSWRCLGIPLLDLGEFLFVVCRFLLILQRLTI
jgi:hypothetical protein